MYELISEGDSIVVTFKAIGMISDGDYDSLNDAMEVIMGKHPYVRVLVDWEQLEGWEPGAKAVSTWFGRLHNEQIQRMAIVADAKWKDEVDRIRDVVAPTEVRGFALSKRDAAMAWLKQD